MSIVAFNITLPATDAFFEVTTEQALEYRYGLLQCNVEGMDVFGTEHSPPVVSVERLYEKAGSPQHSRNV